MADPNVNRAEYVLYVGTARHSTWKTIAVFRSLYRAVMAFHATEPPEGGKKRLTRNGIEIWREYA